MWICKFKGDSNKNVYLKEIIKSIKKRNITVYYYPVNHYIKEDNYYFIMIGVVEGKEASKRGFFKDIKKLMKPSKELRYMVRFEAKGDLFFLITAQTKDIESEAMVRLFYNPRFIHIKPAIIFSNGWEEWEIATFDKKMLEEMLSVAKEKYSGEILKLKEEKLDTVGVLSLLPSLTEKQKQALELAVKEGYYEYPKKIELKKLAKIMNISFSTYQAHLRKAEKKILPFVVKKFE